MAELIAALSERSSVLWDTCMLDHCVSSCLRVLWSYLRALQGTRPDTVGLALELKRFLAATVTMGTDFKSDCVRF